MTEAVEEQKIRSTSRLLRIGAVPYLNVQPLVRDLEMAAAEPGSTVTVASENPRQLAQKLRAGAYDVASVPVFECFLNPAYTIIPNCAIASRGPVASVLLLSNSPTPQIELVRLDTASLTSVNLAQVLFREAGYQWRFVDNQAEAPLQSKEARIMIGDPALLERDNYSFVADLGRMWFELTGLPFVFAAWLVHASAFELPLNKMFIGAKEAGLLMIDQIAAEAPARFGIASDVAARYLSDNVVYDLGEEEIAGWRKFGELCVKHQLLPSSPPLIFHQY